MPAGPVGDGTIDKVLERHGQPFAVGQARHDGDSRCPGQAQAVAGNEFGPKQQHGDDDDARDSRSAEVDDGPGISASFLEAQAAMRAGFAKGEPSVEERAGSTLRAATAKPGEKAGGGRKTLHKERDSLPWVGEAQPTTGDACSTCGVGLGFAIVAPTHSQEGALAVSPWLDPPPVPDSSLRGETRADVCVIGAGLTGLSTALRLAADGARVVVVDGEYAGFGASGRNAGHLTPQIGKDLPTLARLYGAERVRSLLFLVESAIDEVEELIAAHAIDCDYRPQGNILAAVHPQQFRALDRAAATAAAFGLPNRILEPEEMRSRGVPAAFLRGVLEPHGGVLDPGRYVRGLRDAALAAGAILHERSPVIALEDARPAVVRTAEGRIEAEHVVVAVNGYGIDLPLPGRIGRLALPLYVQLLRTEPIGDSRRARIGWPGEEGIYTAHELLESWRLAADGPIVGGSKIVRYGFGGGRLRDRDGAVAQALDAVFRRRFPELADVKIATHWGGRIAMTLDFLPSVGRAGRAGNILYSLGYAGHGLALASYAGTMIADLLAGRDGPGRALWGRRSLPLPPEPLRWAAFQALTKFFAAIDRRVDRRLS